MKKTTTALDQLLKTRKDSSKATGDLSTGVWYGGFAKAKAAAINQGVPFFAVWANEGCGVCTKFEKSLLTDNFKDWQKKSGILFWFGYSGDNDSAVGKKWTKKSKLTNYPFVRLYSSSPKKDVAESGMWWADNHAGISGAKAIVKHIKTELSNV